MEYVVGEYVMDALGPEAKRDLRRQGGPQGPAASDQERAPTSRPSCWSFCWRGTAPATIRPRWQAGMEAVLATLQDNYVRPDEANAAQSKVATKGKHRFIDKVHVRYVEKEKRHWAALENFNSQRIAIGEKFYRDNDRLLEGGIWAEVTLAHNDIDDDDYAFYVEDLRPIQLTRFDFARYSEGRARVHTRRVAGCDPAFGRAGAVEAHATAEAALHRAPGCRWWSPTTTTSSWGRAAPASRTSSASSRRTRR